MQLRANYFVQHGSDVYRAVNINAPVDGVRPDPTLGNITYIDADRPRRRARASTSRRTSTTRRGASSASINYRARPKRMNDGDSATSLPVNSTNLDGRVGAGAQRHASPRSSASSTRRCRRASARTSTDATSRRRPTTSPTGFDNNGDSVINDRPAGVGRNSARAATASCTMDLRLGWNKGFGKPKTGDGQPGGPAAARSSSASPAAAVGGGGRGGRAAAVAAAVRWAAARAARAATTAASTSRSSSQANNLLNNVNYASYSGVITSDVFGQPTSAQAGGGSKSARASASETVRQ